MKEPTPTLEEFVYSFHPAQWFDPTLENLLYWEIKTAITLAPSAVRTAWLMRAGMTLSQAAYAAGDTYTMLRVFRKGHTLVTIASAPAAVVGLGALAAHYHTITSPPPTEALRSEPGQTSWWRAVAQSIGAGGFGVGSWTP